MKRLVVGLAAVLCLAANSAFALITNVGQASEVCPPTTDPCVVSDTVEVLSGSVLDFGTRTVEIVPGGMIDIGSGSVTILCGDLLVSTSSAVAFQASGPDGFGSFDGGVLTVEARGHCALAPILSCLGPGDCPSGKCVADTGKIELDGKIAGSGGWPADVSLRAAGDVRLLRPINLATTAADGDGGSLTVESETGSIFVEAQVTANGGAAGSGGYVSLTSALDTWINARIDLHGGDVDGGWLDVDAGRHLFVAAPLDASSTAGTGSGGTILLAAGGDVSVEAGGEANADGHRSTGGFFAGDGGDVEVTADGVVRIDSGASLHANGGNPDGMGGLLSVAAGTAARVGGSLSARGGAGEGSGGSVELASGGRLDLLSTAAVDVGGDSSGGQIAIDAGAYAAVAGSLDASGGTAGSAGDVRVTCSGDSLITASVANGGTAGAGRGLIEIEACNLEFGGGALVRNDAAPGGGCRLTSHEQLTVGAGAEVTAAGSGNEFVIRTAAKPPIVSGLVTPAAVVTVNSALSACGTCGNGVVESGEMCDDASAAWQPGQPCSSMCTLLECGDPDGSGSRTATDALFVLKAAVGSAVCDPCLCDVDQSGGPTAVSATDALRVLRAAVGQPVPLFCGACPA